MLYTDFIRKKMHNLAKIITANGYPLKIISKFNRKAVDYAIHGATSPGENLIPYPYYDTSGKTHNGITYTIASDGGITLDGTADNISTYFILPTWSNSANIAPPKGKYTLSGLTDGSADTYYMEFSAHKINGSSATTVLLKRCYTEPVAVDLTDVDYDFIGLSIKVKTGVSVDNLVIYPMLNEGETAKEYELYAEYGVGDKTKNLIPYPYSNPSGTVSNGITYTVNPDRSITLNGTCTETWSQFFIKSGSNTAYTLPPGRYTISGCVGQTESSCYLEFVPYKNGSAVSGGFVRQANEPITFDFTDEDYETYNLKIAVRGIGTSFDNFTIYPMINEGETAEEYEPYSEYDYRITLKNTHGDTADTSVIYTNSQIKDGEAISFRADGLPELKLYKGENNITVETEVKPSGVTVRYYSG